MKKRIYSQAVHHGHNIKRLREILGMKQEALAVGLDISQPAVSELESKPQIDDETLEKIAKVLKISVDAIKNFSEDVAFNVIANTFNEPALLCNQCHQPSINQSDKFMEIIERLKEKNIALEKMNILLEEKCAALENRQNR